MVDEASEAREATCLISHAHFHPDLSMLGERLTKPGLARFPDPGV